MADEMAQDNQSQARSSAFSDPVSPLLVLSRQQDVKREGHRLVTKCGEDMEGGSESQIVGTGAPSGTLEGGSSSLEARLSKERRRRERRERRARRQQRNSLISQMDGGCIYDQGVHHVPDLLHHHLPPPPAYTTLPGRARPTSCPQRPMPPPQHSWRENLPAFARR